MHLNQPKRLEHFPKSGVRKATSFICQFVVQIASRFELVLIY